MQSGYRCSNPKHHHEAAAGTGMEGDRASTALAWKEPGTAVTAAIHVICPGNRTERLSNEIIRI